MGRVDRDRDEGPRGRWTGVRVCVKVSVSRACKPCVEKGIVIQVFVGTIYKKTPSCNRKGAVEAGGRRHFYWSTHTQRVTGDLWRWSRLRGEDRILFVPGARSPFRAYVPTPYQWRLCLSRRPFSPSFKTLYLGHLKGPLLDEGRPPVTSNSVVQVERFKDRRNTRQDRS